MKFLDIIKEEELTVPDDVKKFAFSILAHFIGQDQNDQSNSIVDNDINLNDDSFFTICKSAHDQDYSNVLEYTFESDVTQHSSYSSGSYDEPPDYDPAIIEIEIVKLTVIRDDETIYEGPDFTNFMKLNVGERELRHKTPGYHSIRTGETFIWENFSDTLEDQEREQQEDY